ncbi:MAG TPA: flagellar biosynthesis anti-sigma factor FlgM [Thiobacillaceae bacterium]|nr:flagellar biosynthesis anti-sigma factor FlgM [Thiobacillaceae bacterium]
MKINKRITPTGTRSVAAARAKKTSGAGKPSGAGKAGDRAEIAATTSHLQATELELASVDVTDTGKVAEVRQALDAGTFEVDSEVVADRLIETSKEAIRKRPAKK